MIKMKLDMSLRNINVNSLKLPSLSALKVFEAVGRFSSFSIAADNLFVTQSAVSRQILGLEKDLGCRLFIRERNGVRLTEIGRDYHLKVKHSLNNIALATQELKLRNAGLNIIRLTTLPTLAMHWLLPRLPEFKALYPEIAVDISSSNELNNLNDGSMDVGIRFGKGNWQGLVAEHLFDEELITVCSGNHLELFEDSVELALQNCNLLHTTTRPEAWAMWMETHGIKQHFSEIVGFQDFFITIQAAILGQGIAIVPSFLVKNELADGRLFDPTKLGITSQRSYYFVTSEENANREPIIRLKDWIIRAGRSDDMSV